MNKPTTTPSSSYNHHTDDIWSVDAFRTTADDAAPPAPPRFLLPGFLPADRLTLLASFPGVGKSFLALDLAARISAGLPMPFADTPADPGNVLLCLSEDSRETARARLLASGADMTRISFFDGVVREDDKLLLPTEFPKDGRILLEYLRSLARPTLVIFDSLASHLGCSEYSAPRVRAAIDSLDRIAQAAGCAILGICHLAQPRRASAPHRLLGAHSFTSRARSVLHLTLSHDNSTRTLAVAKSNLCLPDFKLTFALDTDRVRWLDRLPAQDAPAGVASEPPVHEISRRTLAEAVGFLRAELSPAPRRAADVLRDASRNGISRSSLIRAKYLLGVQSRKMGTPCRNSHWLWSLPSPDSASAPATPGSSEAFSPEPVTTSSLASAA